MWKNLKISRKLFAGFGFILLVFVASILYTWSHISKVEENSNSLAEMHMLSLQMTTAFNGALESTILAMRTVQYTESRKAVEELRKTLEVTKKAENDIVDLNKKYPDLMGPAYLVEKVFPLLKQYVSSVENTLALMDKKQNLSNIFTEKGAHSSNIIREILSMLNTKLKASIQNARFSDNRTNTLALADAMEQCALLLEKTMELRRDVWHNITITMQSGEDLEAVREITNKIKELQQQVESLKHLFTEREEIEILEKVLSELKVYDAHLNEFMKACIELDKSHQARGQLVESLSRECNIAEENMINRIKGISKENAANLRFAILVLLYSAGGAIFFGIFIIIFIASSISKPLNTIVDLARRAGDGDLTIKKEDFGYDGSDEMGKMTKALADMVEDQNKLMKQIVNIAKELGHGANDLSSISQETNAIMEEIRATVTKVSTLSESNGAALEESNAGVEEMSAGADTVAKSATESASFIAQTTSASNNAIQTVSSVINGMRGVDENAKESEGKIRQLVSSVENVSSFVSVITGIADQTNLLALNAAIEAARAGEVGRGFAVVAEEVRKLAEESARAANSVNSIINELQAGAQASIKATVEAGRGLTSTLEHAEKALDELNKALNQMNNANDSIQNIAAVAEEQAASSKEVSQAIDSATKTTIDMVGNMTNITRATAEAAEASEGVAKQAEAMTKHAKILSELLSVFKLDSNKNANSKMLRV